MDHTASVTALDLLRPFIWRYFGEPALDPEASLRDLRKMAPGRLPEDYATTLLALNRAPMLDENSIISIEPPRPREPGVFECVGPNPPLDMLYGLGDHNHSVIGNIRSISDRLPLGLLAIGDDGGTSRICLDTSEAGNGRIYHWFHLGDPGPDEPDGSPGWGATFLLAHSFTDLCRRLRPAKPHVPSGPVGETCFSRP